VPPVIDIPSSRDRTILGMPLEKVITLNKFLKKILELMKDKISFNSVCGIIDNHTQAREIPTI
jgi:hypothetical protein